MSDHTHIEWCDATWNPITGCSVVSAGCKHCYAMRLAGTRLRHHPSRAGLTRPTSAGPVWTGQVRFNEDWLDQPLRWKKPRRIFVCAHGDLFHESVPDEWIDRVFAVMALAPQHTFQVLTKRPRRMLDWFRRNPYKHILRQVDAVRDSRPNLIGIGVSDPNIIPWRQVWIGVSVEDQATADERIPRLLQTPAAVRFVSAEPLLGPVRLPFARIGEWNSLAREHGQEHAATALDWIIAGGESGPGARPAHPDWFRSLRDQCRAADVPFFFKQWGEWAPVGPLYSNDDTDEHMAALDTDPDERGRDYWITRSGVGWRPQFDGQPPPGCFAMRRAGKRAAGRLLDGRVWDQSPRSAL
jgi:protein gp37